MRRPGAEVAALLARLAAVPAPLDGDLEVQSILEQHQLLIEELRAQNDELESTLVGLEGEYVWYRQLFELGPEPHLVTDVNGRILDGNNAAALLVGVERHRLQGALLPSFVPLAERRSVRHALLEVARAVEPSTLEFTLVARDRFERRLEARVVRHVRPDELHLSWLLHDVTEAREAEAKLRSLTADLEQRVAQRTAEVERAAERAELERSRLEALVHELPMAVLLVDATTREVVLANEHARRLFMQRRTALASPFADPHLEEADGTPIPPHERPLARAIAEGWGTSGKRLYNRGPDGSVTALEVWTVPLRNRGGAIVAGILVAQDVTERERGERAEREFLSNAAHQLRTPVAAIKGAIDVLQAGGKDEAAARERFLGHIARAAHRLSQLSESLLVLARAQAGERPRAEVVEIAPLLRQLATNVRPSGDVTVDVRCRSDLAALASRELLREALASILDNAIRYTRRGHVTLRGRRNHGRVLIEVADTGSGMTPEIMARMFERFYGDRSAGSFGLGLAIAAQAAEAMGARLDVDSKVDQGTTVRLTLAAGMLRTT